ncbi:hypothetical protein MMC30_008574 [Trapelia coarctata]|nr:hypothetical protein [Trapelia coarctata]
MVGDMCKSVADIPLEVRRARHSHRANAPPPPDHAGSAALREAPHIALGAVTGLSKGIGRILLAGFRSPFEVTLAAARGFYHLPLLYGDQSVRKAERITGVVSGLQAVAKEITYSVSDGVGGLLTHPLDSARRDGAVRLAKGVGKGLAGAVLKPLAGMGAI